MRILVVTRSYPAEGDLYQYPFVHRRVVAYAAAGHEVAVFRPTADRSLHVHRFDGVACNSGDGAVLRRLVAEWRPDVAAIHGFSEQMWEIVAPLAGALPICAWLHGSEIPAFFRQKAECLGDRSERATALDAVATRCRFWTGFLQRLPPRFKLVFVSRSAVELAREDWGDLLPQQSLAVIHNPIDTDLFAYRPRDAADRSRILLIRPFDSRTYGNDLAVSAILALSGRSGFGQLGFTIIGDGPLFEQTVAPISDISNVRIERRFLTQPQIAAQHSTHGLFLVPTRLDTQGVSRDEAMSSGLVPVTNRVSAVPEFVDEQCAGLADPDDFEGLAEAIWTLQADPALFLARSAAAARRVRAQSGHDRVIPQEIGLLSGMLDS